MSKKEPNPNLVSEALGSHGDVIQQNCCKKLKRSVVAEGHQGPLQCSAEEGPPQEVTFALGSGWRCLITFCFESYLLISISHSIV